MHSATSSIHADRELAYLIVAEEGHVCTTSNLLGVSRAELIILHAQAHRDPEGQPSSTQAEVRLLWPKATEEAHFA